MHFVFAIAPDLGHFDTVAQCAVGTAVDARVRAAVFEMVDVVHCVTHSAAVHGRYVMRPLCPECVSSSYGSDRSDGAGKVERPFEVCAETYEVGEVQRTYVPVSCSESRTVPPQWQVGFHRAVFHPFLYAPYPLPPDMLSDENIAVPRNDPAPFIPELDADRVLLALAPPPATASPVATVPTSPSLLASTRHAHIWEVRRATVFTPSSSALLDVKHSPPPDSVRTTPEIDERVVVKQFRWSPELSVHDANARYRREVTLHR